MTSPTWNFPGAYSLEFDLAEREEWYSQNTAASSVDTSCSGHSQFNTQRPKFSVRWQPFDQEADAAWELQRRVPCSDVVRAFACVSAELPDGCRYTFATSAQSQIEERQIGNPNLQPEVAYEWSYGSVYSPKWLKGLTVSADWWHIDMRSCRFSERISLSQKLFPALIW